ncbi:2-oxoglutarate and iron-dependent oxygenase JMJD4 [Trichomycterus rosablanca]|uniref:2-oxoglutarate and iron-dependent oxygenase JMJD4 n=1 Tax=Trichomycterus rosablanca TaxID=2290929 RepID=UPI002F354B0E
MNRETLIQCSNCNESAVCRQTGLTGSVHYIQSQTSYDHFFTQHLILNRPCIFSRTFTQHWNCTSTWITDDGKPDFQSLLRLFGETPVPVADCNTKEYNSNPKQVMSFQEFVQYWRENIQKNYSSPRGCLYLKDWHMTRMFPELDAYTTPIYFSSDWLNEYWDSLDVDDYRFVYMGPKGSWTPFHADVFRSYSWSANVCGRKRWLLYPPGQEDFLRDSKGNLAYDVTAPVLQDKLHYPRFSEACAPLEVIQEAGEILFVPSGWHHQVYNLEDTISINHNWMNGCNVDVVWRFLQEELGLMQKEIEEWKETMDSWHQHCQLMMKSCTGMDYAEFASFLRTIAHSRIAYLTSGDTPSKTLSALGPHHARFDLQRVRGVLERMLSDEDFQRVEESGLGFSVEELLHRITETLDRPAPSE